MKRYYVSLISTAWACCGLALQAQAATRYVDVSSTTPLAPYTSWATAATSIQPAIDASAPGDTVLVTDGTYLLAAELSVNKSITIESVNGPSVTVVDGDFTVRCFNLGSTACVISGFTIRNGFAEYADGGGVLCSSTTPVVTNCTIQGNEAFYGDGGGMYQGTANDCVISGNFADLGGGMHGGTANDCTINGNDGFFNGGGLMRTTANRCTISGNHSGVGGGMLGGTANDCTISGNRATSYGGGMYGGTANRCTINGNTAEVYGGGLHLGTADSCVIRDNSSYTNGGGIYESSAINCTITGNSADSAGGGAYDSAVQNSIIWYNSATFGKDIALKPESSFGSADHSCSPDVTHGVSGNTTNPPLFADRAHDDYRLSPGSPGIDTGDDGAVTVSTDIEGNPRVNNGTVDMGAYEFYPQLHDHYVSLSGSHASPFDSWEKAATNLQTAVLFTPDGFTVHVSNGVYHLSSEIAVSSDIVIQSVNGPAVTGIDGGGIDRCFNLGGQACVVSGFTVSNGYTTGHGGGMLCSTSVPVVTNCIIRGNVASAGGGMYHGTAKTCVIMDNTATSFGGGLYDSAANHCTISDNTADMQGGGMYSGTASNSIVWYNSAPTNGNMSGGTAGYTCSTDLPHGTGGNITNDPTLLSSPYLATHSPCIGAGIPIHTGGADIFGMPWRTPPSMGAYEYAGPGSVQGTIHLSVAAPPAIFAGYQAEYDIGIDGPATWMTIDFGDGTVVTNQRGALHYTHAATGSYSVIVSAYNDDYPAGTHYTQAVVVAEDVLYVSDATGDDEHSGYSLGTAKKTIQAAHDVSADGVTIRVDSGTYYLASELVVDRAVTIESISGPETTVIDGGRAVRCLNLGNSACTISGFTITNGISATGGGGGVLCSGAIPVLTNCTIIGCQVQTDGGGMYGGTATDCTIDGNYANGHGAGMAYGMARDCLITNNISFGSGGGMAFSAAVNCNIGSNLTASGGNGGGLYQSTASNCMIRGNAAATGDGGGLYEGTADHCIIIGNSTYNGRGGGMAHGIATHCMIRGNGVLYAENLGGFGGGISLATESGGGLYDVTASNCAIVQNQARRGGGMYDGTAHNCTVSGNTGTYEAGGLYYTDAYNSIIWNNTVTAGNGQNPDAYYGHLEYTCAPEVNPGEYGNITGPPSFQDAANLNYRLRWDSPARDAGSNAYAVGSTDLDGNPRIHDGVVNMGAYEDADTDSDGLTDASEYRYGSNPGLRDSDGDGFEDGYEVTHGLLPTGHTSAFLTAYVHSNAVDLGYFTPDAVLDLGIGDIGVHITNGQAEVTVQMWESHDLDTWTHTTPELQWSVPVDADIEFFRIRAAP